MPARPRPRLLAAAAAAGTLLVSLASGGGAVADELAPAPAATPDTNAPTVFVELPQPSPRGWYTDAVSISLVAADLEGPVASIHWSVDGGPITSVTGSSTAATISTGGEHFFEVYAIDQAGNRSGTMTRDVNVDLAAPWISTFSQPQDTTFDLGEEVLLGYVCADDLSGVDECTDDDRIEGYLDTSAAGPHEVRVRMRDVAGNENAVSYRYTVVAEDTTAPSVRSTVTGTHVNDRWFTGDDVQITLAVDDAAETGVTIDYEVTGQAPMSVPGPSTTFSMPSDGIFDVVYSAIDGSENRSETSVRQVRRDTVAPTISMSASPDTPILAAADVPNGAVVTQDDEIFFTFDCDDATSGVEDCAGEVADGDLLDTSDLGYHSVLVTATDAAGNESSAIFEYTVEEEQQPTDPGTGGDPNGPAQPGGADAPAGQAAAPRPRAAAAAAGDWLAETGGASAPWVPGVAAALLVSGLGAMGATAARRRVG